MIFIAFQPAETGELLLHPFFLFAERYSGCFRSGHAGSRLANGFGIGLTICFTHEFENVVGKNAQFHLSAVSTW
jgi:hypothetical protein